jgi:SAM-dependent methyltransferase
MASTAVLMYLNERSTGDPARDWLSAWAWRWFDGDDLRVLVLGCGEGWLERAVAEWPFVARIDATDVAAEAVARAREGAGPKLHYSVADLNVATLEPNAYDVVIAHSILHHVENLEHCFAQIERAMKPDATLIVNEYAGPNRFQFSDEILAIINDLLACLGYPPKERPSPEQMIANDPTEAVRAAELMPMIEERFEVLERKELGGTILMHLLYEIVPDFRWEDPRERSIIDLLCTFEGALVDAGAIPSDFVIAVARKRGSRAARSSRPLPPRPPAASDIEPDPLECGRLARSGRASRPAARQTQLAPWHLRTLRLALLSTKQKRANLFEESRLRTAAEQLRFALARTSPFDWIIRRWSAYGDDPTIRALLETFERISAAKM